MSRAEVALSALGIVGLLLLLLGVGRCAYDDITRTDAPQPE